MALRVSAVAIGVLLLAWGGTLLTASASSHEFEIRIVARRVASGNTEFALQQRNPGESWGERRFPQARYFPQDAAAGRWLVSTPLELARLHGASPVEARVTARKVPTGSIEFALQRRGADGAWRARELPRARYFPQSATVGRWLVSTPLYIPSPPLPSPTPWPTAIADPPPP